MKINEITFIKYIILNINILCSIFYLIFSLFPQLTAVDDVLPQYITRKVKIEKVRLYASADNLKTWTKFPGMDPEIGTSITYPLMKQCAFGLQLTF